MMNGGFQHGTDVSVQPFSLTGYKDYQVPVNSKRCADEAGSTGLI